MFCLTILISSGRLYFKILLYAKHGTTGPAFAVKTIYKELDCLMFDIVPGNGGLDDELIASIVKFVKLLELLVNASINFHC